MILARASFLVPKFVWTSGLEPSRMMAMWLPSALS